MMKDLTLAVMIYFLSFTHVFAKNICVDFPEAIIPNIQYENIQITSFDKTKLSANIIRGKAYSGRLENRVGYCISASN